MQHMMHSFLQECIVKKYHKSKYSYFLQKHQFVSKDRLCKGALYKHLCESLSFYFCIENILHQRT